MKSRRTVIHSALPRGRKGVRGPKLWAYGYSDLAKLLGTTEGALRAKVARAAGKLSPLDLGSLDVVCRQWALAHSRRARKAGSLGGALSEVVPGTTVVIMPSHRERIG